jgi:two-component sensor histidine kinase
MLGTQFLDLDQDGLAMVVDGIHRQIHYLLVMIEAMIRQTTAASVEDYRAQLMTRIGAFRTPHVIPDRSRGHSLKMTDLIERTLHPYCTTGGRVIVSGPDLLLAPKLSFALHLIFSELALNAKKYGSLSCSCGQFEIQWRVRSVAGASRKLAVVWSENGGPEVKRPRCRGFGTQLLKRAIEGYGAVQLYFNKTGLACSMLIELDHVETPFHSQHPHEQFGINGGAREYATRRGRT